MPALVINKVSFIPRECRDHPSGSADLTVGMTAQFDGTSGKVVLGTASRVDGVIVNLEGPATLLRKGLVDLGGALAAVDFGARIYAGADGAMDTAGTVVVGQVVPAYRDVAPSKLLRVDL